MPLKYSFEVINIVQFLFKMDGAAGVGRNRFENILRQ